MPKSVAIEKFAFGGAGFGRLGGKACFVQYTAPGDIADIEITEEKKSFVTGKIFELLERSPLRIDPECPSFGSCGGCQWQHVSYPVQLQAKEEIFAEIMCRIGRVGREIIEPVVPAPAPFEYRSRIQLKIRFIADKLHMGFYRPGSHFVIDIPEICVITDRSINNAISKIRILMAAFPERDKIPQIDIVAGDDGRCLVTFHYIGEFPQKIAAFIESNNEFADFFHGIWLQSGRKSTLVRVRGADHVTYDIAEAPGYPALQLKFSCGAFSQVNYKQNQALIDTVREWAGLTGREKVLDLFCGNGNFSLALASQAQGILGIEGFDLSIKDAVENCRKNGFDNATYICADAEEGVSRLIERGEWYDLVVIDPPRTGAKEVVPFLHALKPKKIIYISCDPPTLARDIALLRKHDYDVVKSRPIDMFPQTYHLESVTLLEPIKP